MGFKGDGVECEPTTDEVEWNITVQTIFTVLWMLIIYLPIRVLMLNFDAELVCLFLEVGWAVAKSWAVDGLQW